VLLREFWSFLTFRNTFDILEVFVLLQMFFVYENCKTFLAPKNVFFLVIE